MHAALLNRHTRRPHDSAAEFRSAYVAVLQIVNIEPAQSARLAESLSGQPFESCGRTELEPVLERVRCLLHDHALDGSGGTFHVAR